MLYECRLNHFYKYIMNIYEWLYDVLWLFGWKYAAISLSFLTEGLV